MHFWMIVSAMSSWRSTSVQNAFPFSPRRQRNTSVPPRQPLKHLQQTHLTIAFNEGHHLGISRWNDIANANACSDLVVVTMKELLLSTNKLTQLFSSKQTKPQRWRPRLAKSSSWKSSLSSLHRQSRLCIISPSSR